MFGTKSMRVHINSFTDTSAGENTYNLSVQLAKPIQNPKRLRVINASVPSYFPAFTSYDNYVAFTYNAVNYTCNLSTTQNWDYSSFATYFQGILNATVGGAPFTATVDLSTGSLTLTAALPFSFSNTTTALNRLGFTQASLASALVGGLETLTGASPLYLLRTQNVYFLSSIVSGQSQNANQNNRKFNILYKVQNNAFQFGLMQSQNNFVESQFEVYASVVSEIDLMLADDYLRPLELPPNLYFTIELLFETE